MTTGGMLIREWIDNIIYFKQPTNIQLYVVCVRYYAYLVCESMHYICGPVITLQSIFVSYHL